MRIYVPRALQSYLKETDILCMLHQICSRQINHLHLLRIINSPRPHFSPPTIANHSLALLHIQQTAQKAKLTYIGRFEPNPLLVGKLRPSNRLLVPPHGS